MTKRLLSSLLSLALVSLSVQPAAAAARSVVAPNVSAKSVNLSVPVVLPAVNVAAVPQIAVPQLAVPTAAAPVLQRLGVETAPEAKDPQGALDARYDGAQPGRLEASSPVQGGPTGSNGSGSGLTPSSSPKTPSSAGKVPASRAFNNQRGAVNVKVLAVIGGVILTIALVIAIFVHRGNQKDKLWSDSPAAAEVVQVEKARRSNDAETLFKIAADAKKRAAERREAIADAKSRRADKVGELSMSDAEALLAYDELAAARAELNANQVSSDEARRLGKRRPETWTKSLNELDAEARATGFEGRLGNELDNLSGELAGESGSRQTVDAALDRFEKQVPSLGGSALKEQRGKARADLGEFDAEISSERSAHDVNLGNAKSRISTRLYQGNAEFRDRAVRRDALAKLENGTAATAADRAASVERELKIMADRIKQRDDAWTESRRLEDEAKSKDAEAKRLERVEVKVPARDAQGNPMTDAAGNPLYTIEVQDQSGPAKQAATDLRRMAQDKRDEARSAAHAARDAAVRAGRDRDDLVRQAELLRSDDALKSSRVTTVPSSIPGVQVYVVWRWVDLDRQDAEFFFSVLTYEQAVALHGKLAETKGAFEQTKQAIGAARQEQSNWLNRKVDEELERQKKSGF